MVSVPRTYDVSRYAPLSSYISIGSAPRPAPGWGGGVRASRARDADLETAYCAEVLAVTYQAMGLLPSGHQPNWYDAGRFWSGDHLRLTPGFQLGGEIAVQIPPSG